MFSRKVISSLKKKCSRPFCSVETNSSFYKVLGLKPSAKQNEIIAAYHDLAKKYHPDSATKVEGDKAEDSADRFKEISEAYQTLKDEKTRQKYDEYIIGHKVNPDFENEEAYQYWKEKGEVINEE